MNIRVTATNDEYAHLECALCGKEFLTDDPDAPEPEELDARALAAVIMGHARRHRAGVSG